MIDIRARMALIEGLLSQGTVQTATYAALECRSTIETISYDRFAVASSHLALADLRKWQPRDVIKQVIEEANAKAAARLTLSIAKPQQRVRDASVRPEDLEYVEIGQQSELPHVALGRLHNALSNLALHVKIPSPGEQVSIYGDRAEIAAKVEEALVELRKVAFGNLLMGSLGPDCTVMCACGSTIKRNAALLRPGDVVSCNRQACDESYTFSLEDGEAWFTRRVQTIPCHGCQGSLDIPDRTISRLRPGEFLTAICGVCQSETVFKWSLSMATKPATDTTLSVEK
jgi:hypothetical protein